jgi:hypothetical protein
VPGCLLTHRNFGYDEVGQVTEAAGLFGASLEQDGKTLTFYGSHYDDGDYTNLEHGVDKILAAARANGWNPRVHRATANFQALSGAAERGEGAVVGYGTYSDAYKGTAGTASLERGSDSGEVSSDVSLGVDTLVRRQFFAGLLRTRLEHRMGAAVDVQPPAVIMDPATHVFAADMDPDVLPTS